MQNPKAPSPFHVSPSLGALAGHPVPATLASPGDSAGHPCTRRGSLSLLQPMDKVGSNFQHAWEEEEEEDRQRVLTNKLGDSSQDHVRSRAAKGST